MAEPPRDGPPGTGEHDAIDTPVSATAEFNVPTDGRPVALAPDPPAPDSPAPDPSADEPRRATADERKPEPRAETRIRADPDPPSADASHSSMRGRLDDIDGRAPWEVGDLIAGRYEIGRALGGGSMGDVFLAEDRLLKKPVAIKVLRPALAESRDTVRRFLREVALAHSVTHKNVVRIYDTGEEKGLPFFTMEVLRGQVLDELLEAGEGNPAERLPMKKIREIAFDVLDAIDAAHRAGVVHRDLKPGNVMLTHRGAIVMDFGVAGIDDMLERGKAPLSTRSLRSLVRTEVGTIFGSPAYMAPELWEGQPATVQSDLYAFGVMLYQMLTGRLPFSAKTPAAFVEKLSTAPPPPLRSLRRDVPWNLVRLVRRCMARDPEQRPLSASQAANLISPLRGRTRRRVVLGTATLGSLGLGLVLARTTPSWRDLGLPDDLAEAELSAAVRSFDIGERAAALRRLDRLAVRAPDSAALAFWRATVLHDLGDPRGRLARCGDTSRRGSAAWRELAEKACAPTYEVAQPALDALDGGPRSMGPELLPLAVEWHLVPRLDGSPADTAALSLADEVLTRMEEEPDWQSMWAMPVRWKLARMHLAAAMGEPAERGGERAGESDSDPNAPAILERHGLQALLDGDIATAEKIAERLRPIDPTLSRRLQMHDGRLEEAWTAIEAMGADPLAAPLTTMWCGYALRFGVPTLPARCRDLPPGLTRALWELAEGQPPVVGDLDPGEAAIVARYSEIKVGKCSGADARPPRLRAVTPPFELLPAELELVAALCPASQTWTDPVRARTLATALATLSPGDPWLLMARAQVDDEEGHEKLAEAKRLAASERWSGADPNLPLAKNLRRSLGLSGPAPAVAERDP